MELLSSSKHITEMTTTTERINDFILNHTSTVDYGLYSSATFCPETSSNCVIDHTKQCVGDPVYCNLTREEYVELLYDYITPTVLINSARNDSVFEKKIILSI